MNSNRPGEIAQRLAEIDHLLDGELSEPSPQHLELLTERDTLRAEAAGYRTEQIRSTPTKQLIAELDVLRAKRKSLLRASTGFVTSMGGGNSSPSPGAWVGLGAKARSAAGLDDIIQRISSIGDELERRGVE